jgi:hypothetical protein
LDGANKDSGDRTHKRAKNSSALLSKSQSGLTAYSFGAAINGRPIPKLLLENLAASYWPFFALLSAWFLFEFFHVRSLSSDRTIFLLGVALLSASLVDASIISPIFIAGKMEGGRQIHDICWLLSPKNPQSFFSQAFSEKLKTSYIYHESASCATSDISNPAAAKYWTTGDIYLLIRDSHILVSSGRAPPS